MFDETFNLAVAFLLIAMGVYMLFLTRLFPLRVKTICRGLLRLLRPKKGGKKGEISPFEALSAALGGSVGTGNIAGVASAIAIGGPGAIFWMWVSGVIGMATKYAEVLLAMRYRKRGADGAPVGGTMYCILLGMGKGAAPLAVLFAAFTLLASLGCGNMVQVNTIASAVTEAVRAVAETPSLDARLIAGLTGAATAAALGAVLLGGAKRVCSASAYVVPVMSALYIGAAVWVIARFSARLPEALRMIFAGAFGLRPAVGGAIGFSLSRVLRVGMTRGVFSNEAGIGAAPMAYASARCDDPVEQAMMGIFEVFVDTILICTLTALMVLVSGASIPYGDADASGMAIALEALATVVPLRAAGVFLAICVALFAFSSMLGWSLYGVRAAEFLLGAKGVRAYRVLFLLCAFVGAVMEIAPVWRLGEAFNSLMALPNLVMLLALAPEVRRDTHEYIALRRLSKRRLL